MFSIGLLESPERLVKQRLSSEPAVREPGQVPEQNGIEDLSVFRRRQTSFEVPAQRLQIAVGAAIGKKPPGSAQRKNLLRLRWLFIRSLPNHRAWRDEILITGLHGPIVKVMIGPVHREVGAIEKPNVAKTLSRNQHSLAAGWMFDSQISRCRKLGWLPGAAVGMPGWRIASPFMTVIAGKTNPRANDTLAGSFEALDQVMQSFRFNVNIVIDPHDHFGAQFERLFSAHVGGSAPPEITVAMQNINMGKLGAAFLDGPIRAGIFDQNHFEIPVGTLE